MSSLDHRFLSNGWKKWPSTALLFGWWRRPGPSGDSDTSKVTWPVSSKAVPGTLDSSLSNILGSHPRTGEAMTWEQVRTPVLPSRGRAHRQRLQVGCEGCNLSATSCQKGTWLWRASGDQRGQDSCLNPRESYLSGTISEETGKTRRLEATWAMLHGS